MTVSEKAAYIKGLAEGLELDANTKECKVLNAIIDLLSDIAIDLEDVQDGVAMLCEQIDTVDEDLCDLETYVYEEIKSCDCDCDCDCCDDDDDELYEVECPNCHDIIYVDERMLEDEGITCPNCGTNLEFELEDEADFDAE